MPSLLTDLRHQFHPMHRGIRIALWFHAGLLLLSAVALPFDHRTVLGLNPWIKPIKFDMSTLIYAATIGLLLAHLSRVQVSPKSSHRIQMIGWLVAIAMVVENTLISMQSVRGVPSHMNFTSPFNGTTFAVMGIFILVNTVALGMLLRLYLRPMAEMQWPPAVLVGARLGLLLLLLGSVEGVSMVINLGHTVGARDSGDGLPFVNWSTAHGDLRVPHFFALHALQILLLLGWLLSRTRVNRAMQVGGMLALTLIYAAGCGWLFHVAMQGRPLLGL